MIGLGQYILVKKLLIKGPEAYKQRPHNVLETLKFVKKRLIYLAPFKKREKKRGSSRHFLELHILPPNLCNDFLCT